MAYSFLKLINEMSQQNIQRCFQCIKCTAGCPIAYAMDYTPNNIIKMIQLDLKPDKKETCKGLWKEAHELTLIFSSILKGKKNTFDII